MFNEYAVHSVCSFFMFSFTFLCPGHTHTHRPRPLHVSAHTNMHLQLAGDRYMVLWLIGPTCYSIVPLVLLLPSGTERLTRSVLVLRAVCADKTQRSQTLKGRIVSCYDLAQATKSTRPSLYVDRTIALKGKRWARTDWRPGFTAVIQPPAPTPHNSL